MDLEYLDLVGFEVVEPLLSDSTICGRGRIELSALKELFVGEHETRISNLEEDIKIAQEVANAAYSGVNALADSSAPFDAVMIRIQGSEDSDKFVKLTFRKDENGIYPVYEEV